MKKSVLISDKAVKEATGKTLAQWKALLDRAGAKDMTHRDIVRLLETKKLATSGWWRQAVTVGYEKLAGKRVTGKSSAVGYEIGVTKTLPVAPDRAWKIMLSPQGRAVWLGKGRFTAKPGTIYRTAAGTTGEVRTMRAGQFIRLTWQPQGAKRGSMLQVRVAPRRSMHGTCISFHQEKLSSAAERTKMRAHWQRVLKKLEPLLTN